MNVPRETRGPTFELTRHFIRSFFDSELLSVPGQWIAVFTAVLSVLLPAGILLVDQRYFGKYTYLSSLDIPEPYRLAVLSDNLLLLTFVMALSGLMALLQWQSLFPAHTDHLALASLPVKPWQVFVSKALALQLFACIVIVAINLLPSIVFPLVSASRWQRNPSALANLTAYAVSSAGACCFSFFAMVAVQGALLSLLPARAFRRVAVYVQAGLLIAALCVAVFSISITELNPAYLEDPTPPMLWLPSAWFLGLHEMMLGGASPLAGMLSSRAVFGLMAVLAILIACYVGAYGRYRILFTRAPRIRPPRRRLGGTPDWANPRELGLFAFMWKMILRSRQHRLVILAYIGVAVALVVTEFVTLESAGLIGGHGPNARAHAALCAPILLIVFTFAGLRNAFSIPVRLQANWMFRLAGHPLQPEMRDAMRRLIRAGAILPILLAVLPLEVAVLGWRRTLAESILMFVFSLVLYEWQFAAWDKIPFTCSYYPGKRPLLLVLTGYLVLIFFGVPVAAAVLLGGILSTTGFVVVLALLLAVLIWMRSRRRKEVVQLQYESLPDSFQGLRLGQE